MGFSAPPKPECDGTCACDLDTGSPRITNGTPRISGDSQMSLSTAKCGPLLRLRHDPRLSQRKTSYAGQVFHVEQRTCPAVAGLSVAALPMRTLHAHYSCALPEIDSPARPFRPCSGPPEFDFRAAGRIVPIDVQPSIADGLTGNLDPDTITFDIVRDVVDEIVVIDELDLRRALAAVVTHEHLVIEGAAAAGPAALLTGKVKPNGNVAVVLTGANIDTVRLLEILSGAT